MIRNQLIKILAGNKAGDSTSGLASALGLPGEIEDLAIIDALLLLSPECRRENNLWFAGVGSRSGKITAEIRRYADATGKRIFRASAALAKLPPHEHPTTEELNSILAGTNGEFELLPNAMIKKVSQ